MRFKNYLKKKKYLMHLLLTIAGVLCIPLILSQMLMLELSTQGYFRMNEENIREKLQERTTAFVQQIEDMSVSAIKASQDTIIRRASKKTSSDYAVYEAALKLKDYRVDTWIMGVLFYDSDSVLINEVRITPQRLYEMIGGQDENSKAALKTFFEEGEGMRIMSTAAYSGNGTGTIVVGMPVSFEFSMTKKDMLVFFLMEQSVVIEEFSDKFYDYSGVALMDPEGNFLVRNAEFCNEGYYNDEFRQFLADGSQQKHTVVSNGERICIYKYTEAEGYTCLVSMNEENQEMYLREYVTNIRILLMVSIIVMLLLLLLTVMINYRPIWRLTQRHEDRADSAELSELELLDSAFFVADQKMQNMNRLLKINMISDLLSGRPVAEKRLEESGIDKNNLGCVVMALNGPAITTAHSDRIITAMKVECDCDLYITGITYRPQILMVCVLYQDMDTQWLENMICEQLKKVTGHSYSISSGKQVDRITEIRASYLSVLTSGGEKESSMAGIKNNIADAIQRFGESLHSGDAAKIQKRLDVVESLLAETDETEAFKTYYCYKLLMVYFANIGEDHCPKNEKERLVRFEDSSQLFVMMKQSVRAACANMKESEGATGNKLSQKLLDYVNENLTNQDLCLTSAADHLGTSIYVVSRLFKETTGKGFKEFVTDRRLDYARGLLETTNQNVSDIASMAGFENAVYFSNVFKSKYGLAPTLYRKKQQDE